MKSTMDYMVGNTAIQIVNKGNKIKIINVEKEKIKKKFLKKCIASVLVGILTLGSCLYVVELNNARVFLDRQVYSLQGEIDELEKEIVLAREGEQTVIDYGEILEKAKSMGMNFPKNEQIYRYTVEKSTAIRINPSFFQQNKKTQKK